MKKKLWYVVLLLCATTALYVPEATLYRDHLWRYEHIPGLHIQEREAKEMFQAIEAEVRDAQEMGTFTPALKYRLDETIQKVRFGLDLPEVYVVPGTRVLGYQDESEVPPKLYWDGYRLEELSREAMKRAGWGPSEHAEYQRLRFRPEVSRIWNPELKRFPKTRHLAGLTRDRLGFLVSIALLSLLLRLSHVGWVFRRLFSRQTLQATGYLLTLGLSFCTTPAVAQQLLTKVAKKRSVAQEEPLRHTDTEPAPGHEPPKRSAGDLHVEAFGDLTHDRQQFWLLTKRLSARFSLAVMNQNRQATSGASSLTFAGLGLKAKLTERLSLTALSGPQQEWKKGRVDQQTTFVNVGYRSPSVSLLFVNRFSRGLDGKAQDAHRHIVAARAGPMPKWLSAEVEVRRSKGTWSESFWGPMVSYGQLLPKNVRGWLGGLYAWPHYDFCKRNWDVRLGLARDFSF